MISRGDWIFPSWVLLPWIMFIVCLTLYTCNSATNNDNISAGKFLVYDGKSRPSDISGCWTKSAVKPFSCYFFCAQNISCAAVFIEAGASGTGSFDCHLCKEEWSISSLGAGTDRYAVSKFGARGVPAPTVKGATLDKVNVHRGGMAAFYNCPTGTVAKQFELAYDDQSESWPQMSEGCQKGLCGTESVDGVMMRMSEPSPGVYQLYPMCSPDERARGHIECSSDSWTAFDDLGRICIPQTCQTTNSLGRSVYQGNLNTTPTGRTCQRWDRLVPWPHFYSVAHFLEDFNSVGDAGNFCRDPGNDGYVWCYTTDLYKRWEECTIPDCQ